MLVDHLTTKSEGEPPPLSQLTVAELMPTFEELQFIGSGQTALNRFKSSIAISLPPPAETASKAILILFIFAYGAKSIANKVHECDVALLLKAERRKVKVPPPSVEIEIATESGCWEPLSVDKWKLTTGSLTPVKFNKGETNLDLLPTGAVLDGNTIISPDTGVRPVFIVLPKLQSPVPLMC